MADLVRFQILTLPPCRIVGRALKVDPKEANPIPAFWEDCFQKGIFTQLEQMEGLYQEILPDADDAYLSWNGELETDGSFTYMIGMLMRPDTPVPEGLDYRDLPQCRVAIGQIKGTIPEVYAQEMDLLLPEMEKLGLVPDSFSMEVYACPRFTTPDPIDGTVILDYYVQIK